MSTCQCSMAISMLGDGCRYCQPQTYIEHLLETLEDARAAPVSEAKAQVVVMPERDAVIRKVVGMCNRIPGSTTWNAAEYAYDELAARLNATPAAPAAGAGLVEALEMALEIGEGCSRGFLGKFQAKARAALASHRAQGWRDA